MTVSIKIDQYITENGGDARDALNVALARIALLEAVCRITNDMAVEIRDEIRRLTPEIEGLIQEKNALMVNYDALTYQIRERDEFCQSQGPVNCPLKVHHREGMGSL